MQKYERYLSFLSENFQFLEIKFSVYLNRRVFVMLSSIQFWAREWSIPESNFIFENYIKYWCEARILVRLYVLHSFWKKKRHSSFTILHSSSSPEGLILVNVWNTDSAGTTFNSFKTWIQHYFYMPLEYLSPLFTVGRALSVFQLFRLYGERAGKRWKCTALVTW